MPRYTVIAVPLGRPEIVAFLMPPRPLPRGARLRVIDQRPTLASQSAWADRLRLATNDDTRLAVLADHGDPHGHMITTTTDRLVPAHFLHAEADYLTRNLGGWAAVYFAVVDTQAAGDWPADPVLNHAQVLAHYGERIRYFGADPAQLARRIPQETGLEVAPLAEAFTRLDRLRRLHLTEAPPPGSDWQVLAAWAMRLYSEIAAATGFATPRAPAIPAPLLLDALLDALVRVEQRRRAAIADEDDSTAEAIAQWLAQRQSQNGLVLILKGEYIMGRHRRSTVLIAPELGEVVKQPAPEPFHEAQLGAVTYAGQPENWPVLTRDGALVTPAGRIRQVVDEDIIAPLNRVFDHPVRLSTLLGLILEPFVKGPTLQDFVLQQRARLTPAVYEMVVLHQQVCERLGIENGDWHSANFIVTGSATASSPPPMVHIDWGAARPLRDDERTAAGVDARLQQVRNLAFSFHDSALAAHVETMHAELVRDAGRMALLRDRADGMIRAAGLSVQR